MMNQLKKLKLGEKVGYALGDTAANISWRTLTTFLLIFYTDVYGISAAAAGILLLVTRLSDGVTDVIMGMIADRTNTKQGKFRPWILWSALPLGILMSLTFTTPDFGPTGKLVYAYATYILLTLVYTANNVPYSALMGVMTPDDKERTSLSSYRFAGAYLGGIITQGLLIYLVLFLGNGDENKGYQYSIYLLSAVLVIFFLITYLSTKERVKPVKKTQNTLLEDLKDLITNKAWLTLLFIGFGFVTYNSIKQGITVIYFKRFLGSETLAASYMVVLLVVSMLAAFVTTPLAKKYGKKNLFLAAMLLSGAFNALIYFFSDPTSVFIFGSLSEFFAGMTPVLFFAMLGDSSDFSEWKTGRRATGLVFSAGTFAMKFGGGVAGAIIGFVLTAYNYDGMAEMTSEEAKEGIKLLMSWGAALVAFLTFLFIMPYPLTKSKVETINEELEAMRVEQAGD